jgi:hypothetical protein
MIIFCFLTYNDIKPIHDWNLFFDGVDQSNYQVWIHPKTSINKNLYKFPVNIVQNKVITINKSHISIVKATLQLFKESILSINLEDNKKKPVFIFCSQNCIPLNDFNFYNTFTSDLNKSIVSYIDLNCKERYFQMSNTLKRYISYNQFVKQQPNMILIYDDVKLLIDNDMTIHFKSMICGDEHYFINILLYILKRNIIKSQTHFCNYDLKKTQAIEFYNPSNNLKNSIKKMGFLFMRKVFYT